MATPGELADNTLQAYRVRMWLGVFAVSGGFWFAVGLSIRALLS